MILNGEHLTQVSFPLGGIGAGCIGLAGNGRLIDWEIFNQHPNKGAGNGMSHFAVRAEKNGAVVDARILNGDLTGSYQGDFTRRDHAYRGWGWGPMPYTLAGMPHFKNAVFKGEFPVAEIEFWDDAFPGKIRMTAWSVFVPGDSLRSGLPAACFEITVRNTTAEPLDYTCSGALSNPWKAVPEAVHELFRENGISTLVLNSGLPADDFHTGSMALSTDAEEISFQQYWFRGGWCDPLEVFWHDFTTPGKLKNRIYSADSTAKSKDGTDTGCIAAHFPLAPGEEKCVRFIISWYSPWAKNDWDDRVEERMANQNFKGKNLWRSYYATVWKDARDAALTLWKDYRELRRGTFDFHDALFSSTIPRAALEGISANLSILKTPTLLRLEDGTVWGWEGLGWDYGSCPGSCSHVWNYAQALALLFPDLERTIRESQFSYNFDPSGGLHFRIFLPLGLRYGDGNGRSAVDASFGEVLKTFREWKVSGDGEWLKRVWPSVKRVMEYAWSDRNPDRWDPERSGVITGRQHHTLDMELFGPTAWLTGHYLAALKAVSEMAPACGEPEFGAECLALFEKGRRWIDSNLFNGEYYIQKIDLRDRSLLRKFKHFHPETNSWDDPEAVYWDDEHGEIKYQIGNGCEIDMHLPQWYASLYGIGEIFERDHVHSTLNAVYRYNFVPHMRDIVNAWRKFSLNDEGGTMICTWPHSEGKPTIPLPYHQETMTGFEWAAAAHLVMFGELDKGLALIEAIRGRYDGYRRNPWNEIECGSNYARAMASYGLLQAYSGFHYDMTRGMIGFAPKLSGEFKSFWSLGTVWGLYAETETGAEVRILHGSMVLKCLELGFAPSGCSVGGREIAYQPSDNSLSPEQPLSLKQGDVILIRK